MGQKPMRMLWLMRRERAAAYFEAPAEASPENE
jgi:hypothetical protein